MASYFITHPEVEVDPNLPIEQWGLSPAGLDRAQLIPRSCWDDGVVQIVSSTEQKVSRICAGFSQQVEQGRLV